MASSIVSCYRCMEEITQAQVTENYRGYYYHSACLQNLLDDVELARQEETLKEISDDPVNHPSHYTSDPSGVECITITRHRNFNVGNAMKYLWRAGLKDFNPPKQDFEKAIFYIKDEIERLYGKDSQNGK